MGRGMREFTSHLLHFPQHKSRGGLLHYLHRAQSYSQFTTVANLHYMHYELNRSQKRGQLNALRAVRALSNSTPHTAAPADERVSTDKCCPAGPSVPFAGAPRGADCRGVTFLPRWWGVPYMPESRFSEESRNWIKRHIYIFFWALKTPFGKAGFCDDMRNASRGGDKGGALVCYSRGRSLNSLSHATLPHFFARCECTAAMARCYAQCCACAY